MITLLLTFLVLSPTGVARLMAGILGMALEPALLIPAMQVAVAVLQGQPVPTGTDPYVAEAGQGIAQIFVDAKLDTPRGITLLQDILARLTALAPAA
jgi:hypothetical protein